MSNERGYSMEYTLDYEKLVSSISIPEIKNDCRFWMLRTKEGFFYNEFLTQGFIAIGWNIITEDILTKEKDADLKLLIAREYPQNEKVPGNALNKCKRFIHGLQENDIILIVGNHEIAFAKIGEYFEDNNPSRTVTKELEVHKQIETKTLPDEGLFCPYKKRRKIEVIRTISLSSITPILYKVLAANRHSLSEITEYKNAVLESCFDAFIYEDKLSIIFHVDRKDPISSLDFSQFIYFASKIIPVDVTTKASVHSPGQIILTAALTSTATIASTATDAINFLESHPYVLAALWLTVFGGKFKDLEVNSFVNLASKLLNYKNNQKLKELEIEEKKEDVRAKQIQNARDEIALKKEEKEYEVYLTQFAESAQRMDVRSVDSNVVDFTKILESKNDNKTDKDNKV